MHTHRTRATAPVDPAGLKQALLGLVCEDHQPLWSLAELDRTLAPSDAARSGTDPGHADVEDAVADLYAAGLIHRIGDFVFATRAALEAERVNA
jgi:HD-like signal output (HDOD) protein